MNKVSKKVFNTLDDLLHFVAENQLEQFAVLRQSDTEWEVSFVEEQEDQPALA